MESKESCRICCCSLSATHSVSLFSSHSIKLRVAERLSRILSIPVIQDHSISNYICRSCNKKFLMAEAFVELARTSYSKTGVPPCLDVQTSACRKRTKETSGHEASPHTMQARPTAKHHTAGRRLDFSSGKQHTLMFYNNNYIGL